MMKNLRLTSFILLAIFWLGCTPNPSNNENPDIETPKVAIPTNTLSITEKCAVILDLSSSEIDSLRASYSEDVFAEIASDIGFYNATASEDLKEKGITVLSTDKENIIFTQSNGKQTKIKRKSYKHDLIFFNPDQEPLGTFTADFEKDLSYFGISNDRSAFTEGYWVGLKALDSAGKDHIFRYFYKTSFINDEPLLQVFDNGDIKVEELLELQKDGSYKQANEDIFYEFNNGEDITMTQDGFVGGLIAIPENRIKE